jgi:hypothetical protein
MWHLVEIANRHLGSIRGEAESSQHTSPRQTINHVKSVTSNIYSIIIDRGVQLVKNRASSVTGCMKINTQQKINPSPPKFIIEYGRDSSLSIKTLRIRGSLIGIVAMASCVCLDSSSSMMW